MTEQKLKDGLLRALGSLDVLQDDAKRTNEFTGEYVKDAIAKIEIALRHLDD